MDEQNQMKKDFQLTTVGQIDGQIDGQPKRTMPLATVIVGANTAVAYLQGYTLSILEVERLFVILIS